MDELGAALFGLVVGWVTYRTLRRNAASVGLSDIATVVGAVGGAAVTALFDEALFAWYSIGLAVGFFGYLFVALRLEGPKKTSAWMGAQYDRPSSGADRP